MGLLNPSPISRPPSHCLRAARQTFATAVNTHCTVGGGGDGVRGKREWVGETHHARGTRNHERAPISDYFNLIRIIPNQINRFEYQIKNLKINRKFKFANLILE